MAFELWVPGSARRGWCSACRVISRCPGLRQPSAHPIARSPVDAVEQALQMHAQVSSVGVASAQCRCFLWRSPGFAA